MTKVLLKKTEKKVSEKQQKQWREMWGHEMFINQKPRQDIALLKSERMKQN